LAIDHNRTDSIDQALAYRITRAARLLRTDLARVLEPFGVAPEHFYLLFRLHERDGRAQGELVDPVLDDRANISRLVAVLERRGLVVRRPDPTDARVRRVYLEPTGRDLMDQLLALALSERARLFGGLTVDQLAALDHALSLIEAQSGRA
jgi:MarR family transcriptional regulator, organic hydroperoxide resistance regulator